MYRISVVIPTYKRLKDLSRCLIALQNQCLAAEEVLIVVRDTDKETWDFLEEFAPANLPLKVVKVCTAGVVDALNAGIDSASGDIIAITDDDAAPHPDWLERIQTHFVEDEKLGGIGGRDWVYVNDKAQTTTMQASKSLTVGKIQWFGRTIGNHHLGDGVAREVDILKGVNMSYRRDAIEGLRFDHRLLGTGAQVHNEMLFSLEVKKRGWKLVYDPAIAVDHYPAQRFDEDQRYHFNPKAALNQAHNESLALLMYVSPIQKLVFVIWSALIGTRRDPGILQLFRLLPQEKMLIISRTFFCQLGRLQGLYRYLVSLPWHSA